MRVIVVVVYEGDGGHTFSQWILSAASSSSSSSAQSAARAAEDAAIEQEQAMRMDSGSQSQRQGKARLRQRRRNKTHTHTQTKPRRWHHSSRFACRLSHKATVVEAELQYRYLPLSFGNHREKDAITGNQR